MKIEHITEKYWRADEPKPKLRKPSRKHQSPHPGQKRGMVGEMGEIEGTDAYRSLEREALMMLKYLHNDYVKSGRVNAFELPRLLTQHMPEINSRQAREFFSTFIDKRMYEESLDEVSMADIKRKFKNVSDKTKNAALATGAAGAIALGSAGLNDMNQEQYERSGQLQQLEQHLDYAEQVDDQRMIDQLEQRIANHKMRLDLGYGEVKGKDMRPIAVVYDKEGIAKKPE